MRHIANCERERANGILTLLSVRPREDVSSSGENCRTSVHQDLDSEKPKLFVREQRVSVDCRSTNVSTFVTAHICDSCLRGNQVSIRETSDIGFEIPVKGGESDTHV